MILELDLGNSFVKWRLVDEAGGMVARGRSALEAWLVDGLPPAWGEEISRVRVASVRSDDAQSRFAELLQQRCAARAEFAQVSDFCAGVRNGYMDPRALGVDRWLAIIAAYSETQGAVLVVDAGSALTIDLVDRVGLHRGGYIIPGAQVMRQSLLRKTDRVRYEEAGWQAERDWGRSTESCVLNGVLLALVGALERAIVDSCRLLAEPPKLYLTGGDAGLLLKASEFLGCEHRPELVLDGLRHVLP